MIDNDYIIMCLYIDDMIIFGTSSNIMKSTKLLLSINFDMKVIWNEKYNVVTRKLCGKTF